MRCLGDTALQLGKMVKGGCHLAVTQVGAM